MGHGLHGFTRRVWGLPGHRPVAAMKQVYQWGYVYGAVGLGLARREFLLAEPAECLALCDSHEVCEGESLQRFHALSERERPGCLGF